MGTCVCVRVCVCMFVCMCAYVCMCLLNEARFEKGSYIVSKSAHEIQSSKRKQKKQRRDTTSDGLVRMREKGTDCGLRKGKGRSKEASGIQGVFGHGRVWPRSKQAWVALFSISNAASWWSVTMSGVNCGILPVSSSPSVLPALPPFFALQRTPS
ncbi:MAG: hypothetical protein JOS17DRAFT_6352 [Linnemannia elongata]|nr:MAG: hypothetical protein JOS17DRAFT_6352 [Linnemannia elongata]